MRRVIAILSVGGLMLSAVDVVAQQLPQTLRVVNPMAPGGSSDIALRILGHAIQEKTGQTIVNENRVGGASAIALNYVKNAEPDGSVIVMCESSAMASNVWLFKKLTYDPLKDFKPITTIYSVPVILVVPASSPASTIQELIDHAKRKPGGLNYASQSVGASGHLFGAYFAKIGGVTMTHVPFRGAAQAVSELLADRIDLAWTSYPNVKPYHEAKKIKILATTAKVRDPLLPDVPTVREAGYPQFELSFWFGLCAPANTPDSVVQALNERIVAAVRNPAVLERFSSYGFTPDTSSPAEFTARLKSDTQAFKPIVESTGAKID